LITPKETAEQCTAILDELERAVIGRRRSLELVLMGILAGGHVLLEDLPGLGKTLIARSFARVLGLDFNRIQFTPDLLPSDVTGAPLYDQRTGEMVFRPGPVFTQLLLADEINRTPPKTQAALLEAMGEGQVSVDGQTRKLASPFVVLATDNPIEYEGTYELPEAQLDRFLMRLRLGYLSAGDETAMLARRVSRASEYAELSPVTTAAGVLALRESLEQVEITPDLLEYIVAIVTATRKDAQIQVGASPRGGLALVQLARGQAVVNRRDYVIPDDIKQVAVPALAHRVTLRPELWVRQVSADDVVARLLTTVPTPKTDPAVHAATRLWLNGSMSCRSAGGCPGTRGACSRSPWRRRSSRRSPGAPSSRAWPRRPCCCWRRAAVPGHPSSPCAPGPAPGAPSRASSSRWTPAPRAPAPWPSGGPCIQARDSSPPDPPPSTGRRSG
jgi:MoxR-like ATPase